MTLSLTLSFELYQTSFFLDQEPFLPLISFNTRYSFYTSFPVTTRLGSGHAAPERIPG